MVFPPSIIATSVCIDGLMVSFFFDSVIVKQFATFLVSIQNAVAGLLLVIGTIDGLFFKRNLKRALSLRSR